MVFEHILAAVDYSEMSARALRTAARLAVKSSAKLSVLHSEVPSVPREDVADTLEQFIEGAGLPPEVEPEQVLASGVAAFDAVEWAREHEVDLIVCGTHDRSDFGRLMLGSFTEPIVRMAHCPVWIVKKETPSLEGRTILLPTDFSPTCEIARRLAFDLADLCGASIRVLHVISRPPYNFGDQRHLDAFVQSATPEVEQELALRYASLNLTVEHEVTSGRPSREILRALERSEAPLLVLGTHSLAGAHRSILGAVASKVYQLAPGGVLLVPWVQD